MKSKKQYYKNIDIIRVVACMAILLYHLGILKGGYLAVCAFFVLTGYLSTISAFKKEKFSLKEYYVDRILKIYLPLALVVFLTTFAVSLFVNVNWLNLKTETTSVLLGYNNFWQLEANLDYFSYHINSPFMHLWYIGILLQFELVFPFIYMLLRKVGDKIHKVIPCLTLLMLSTIGAIYFYKMSINADMMVTYYDTLTRIFSILFGMSIGFIHSYFEPLVMKPLRGKILSKIVFSLYLLASIIVFFLVASDSPYFAIAMIGITLATCRLLDYAVLDEKEPNSIFDKAIKYISNMSYKIYLVQYPIIYLCFYLTIPDNLRLIVTIAIILIVSFLLHSSLTFKKNSKLHLPNFLLLLILLRFAFFGVGVYIYSEDHTAEMKELENQLAEKENDLAIKQEEYALRMKKEQEDWLATLDDLQNGEEKIEEIVANLSIVGIGDSIMLGAIDNLYEQFPNGYFDAKVSRSIYVTKSIIEELKESDLLGEPIVLNLGANGDCSESCKIDILTSCDDRDIFWVTVTNDADVHINDKLVSLASKYDNLHIIDWASISQGHSEYFYIDGIHLTLAGRKAYTKAIYDALYEFYLQEYEAQKQSIIDEHEKNLLNKIAFYGNDLLLNAFDELHDEFEDAKFNIDKDFSAKELKSQIERAENDDSLDYNIVFAFDTTLKLNADYYRSIKSITDNHNVYIVAMDKSTAKDLSSLSSDNIEILEFYKEIEKHEDYLMVDGIHLTKSGNAALREYLKNTMK